MEITKKEFDKAYDKHLPNKFIKLAYRYFSTATERNDYGVKNTITYILLGLFIAGLFLTMIGAPNKTIGLFAISYSIILTLLVGGLFISVKLNNFRIGKVCKGLGIKRWEYNNLVSKFYLTN